MIARKNLKNTFSSQPIFQPYAKDLGWIVQRGSYSVVEARMLRQCISCLMVIVKKAL